MSKTVKFTLLGVAVFIICVWLLFDVITYSYWKLLCGTVQLPLCQEYSVVFPNDIDLEGHVYDLPDEINLPGYYEIQNNSVKCIIVKDKKSHTSDGYFLNLKERSIHMTISGGIKKTSRDNTIATIDNLSMKKPLECLMKLDADYCEGNNVMGFYVKLAPEDTDINHPEVASKLLIYHKWMNIILQEDETGK